ncbi:hypothetical protein BDK51DRAFT_31461, partial [Blyttiomyces helicus]
PSSAFAAPLSPPPQPFARADVPVVATPAVTQKSVAKSSASKKIMTPPAKPAETPSILSARASANHKRGKHKVVTLDTRVGRGWNLTKYYRHRASCSATKTFYEQGQATLLDLFPAPPPSQPPPPSRPCKGITGPDIDRLCVWLPQDFGGGLPLAVLARLRFPHHNYSPLKDASKIPPLTADEERDLGEDGGEDGLVEDDSLHDMEAVGGGEGAAGEGGRLEREEGGDDGLVEGPGSSMQTKRRLTLSDTETSPKRTKPATEGETPAAPTEYRVFRLSTLTETERRSLRALARARSAFIIERADRVLRSTKCQGQIGEFDLNGMCSDCEGVMRNRALKEQIRKYKKPEWDPDQMWPSEKMVRSAKFTSKFYSDGDCERSHLKSICESGRPTWRATNGKHPVVEARWAEIWWWLAYFGPVFLGGVCTVQL